jgi:hypothetical protein
MHGKKESRHNKITNILLLKNMGNSQNGIRIEIKYKYCFFEARPLKSQ